MRADGFEPQWKSRTSLLRSVRPRKSRHPWRQRPIMERHKCKSMSNSRCRSVDHLVCLLQELSCKNIFCHVTMEPNDHPTRKRCFIILQLSTRDLCNWLLAYLQSAINKSRVPLTQQEKFLRHVPRKISNPFRPHVSLSCLGMYLRSKYVMWMSLCRIKAFIVSKIRSLVMIIAVIMKFRSVWQ